MATTYVILAEHTTSEGKTTWKEIGQCKAHNPRSAIQTLLLDEKNTDLRAPSYVGVPMRNFVREHPAVRTEQRVVFGATQAEADSQGEQA